MVRKDSVESREFDAEKNFYASSAIDSWLSESYLALLASALQGNIAETMFYYTPGAGYMNDTVTTLSRKVFLLSATEVSGTRVSSMNEEGTVLPISDLIITSTQWTRTPHRANSFYAFYVRNKYPTIQTVNYQWPIHPAFTLPATLAVTANADGTYTLAA